MGQTKIIPILGSASLRVTWDAAEAADWLTGLETRLRDPRPLWGRIGAVMRESFRQDFATGGRPEWTPLAPATVAGKGRFLAKKPQPPFTKAGKVPLRLLQGGQFGPTTILIRTGKLRDSWVQKDAAGHVETVDGTGRQFFIGSQLTLERTLPPNKPVRPYHLLTKKAKAARAKGQTVTAGIPLARFHQEGTTRMPARPLGVLPEDLTAMAKATTLWVLGD